MKNKSTVEPSVYEKVAQEQYSRNQSFGSMVDVQSYASKFDGKQSSILSNVDAFIKNNNLSKPTLSRSNLSQRSLHVR
jgi:hypothetical protein